MWKKSGWVLPLFKNIFLKNRSLSNARWFYSKKCKIGYGNLYLTENWFSRNEMWCAMVIHNHASHMCRRIWQNINFSWNCPKFHILTKILILKVKLDFFRPTASTLEILWSDMLGMYFFIFASCVPLRCDIRSFQYGWWLYYTAVFAWFSSA